MERILKARESARALYFLARLAYFVHKDILSAPFVKEMCDTTANMYRLGWDERNGGNISYMLDESEVGEYLDLNNVIRTIPLAGVNEADFE